MATCISTSFWAGRTTFFSRFQPFLFKVGEKWLNSEKIYSSSDNAGNKAVMLLLVKCYDKKGEVTL